DLGGAIADGDQRADWLRVPRDAVVRRYEKSLQTSVLQERRPILLRRVFQLVSRARRADEIVVVAKALDATADATEWGRVDTSADRDRSPADRREWAQEEIAPHDDHVALDMARDIRASSEHEQVARDRAVARQDEIAAPGAQGVLALGR